MSIREFEKRHSGNIERVSKYRSIGYRFNWFSEVLVIRRSDEQEYRSTGNCYARAAHDMLDKKTLRVESPRPF